MTDRPPTSSEDSVPNPNAQRIWVVDIFIKLVLCMRCLIKFIKEKEHKN